MNLKDQGFRFILRAKDGRVDGHWEHPADIRPGGFDATDLDDDALAHYGIQPIQLVDWLGLALELEAQAKVTESKSAMRAMYAAARGLRLMGGDIAREQAALSDEQLSERYTRSSGGPNPFYTCRCGASVPGVRNELEAHARNCP